MKAYLWTTHPLEEICGLNCDEEPAVCGASQRRECEQNRDCIFFAGEYEKCRPVTVEIKECSRYGKAQARKALE